MAQARLREAPAAAVFLHGSQPCGSRQAFLHLFMRGSCAAIVDVVLCNRMHIYTSPVYSKPFCICLQEAAADMTHSAGMFLTLANPLPALQAAQCLGLQRSVC